MVVVGFPMVAAWSVNECTLAGVVMLKVCGKLVYVKEEKTDKGRHYKRLQLFSNGGAGRAVLYDVTDMGNESWSMGSDVELPCSIEVYQGKRGLGYSLTYWGKAVEGVSGSSGEGGPPGAPAAVGAAKSSAKFS